MIINRVWCMPSHKTFEIKPIRKLLTKYVTDNQGWIDPFACESKVAATTNDLNPDYNTDFHMDALKFLEMFGNESVQGVLYDPPYSSRQVSECYKNVGIEVTKETTQSSWRSRHMDEIQRILSRGGVLISFGWNSSGAGKIRGFEIVEILLISHGGSHNDTIVTVERKV